MPRPTSGRAAPPRDIMKLRSPYGRLDRPRGAPRALQLVRVLPVLILLALALLAGPDALSAQQTELPGSRVGEQSLRAYWHVFAAYTIVILLIGGWAVSIARRLRDVEDRLVD